MIKLRLVIILSILLLACEQSDNSISPTKQNVATENQITTESEVLPVSAFMQTEWTDLLPEDDLDALLNPPSYLDEIVDGSAEDILSNTLKSEATDSGDDRYQQALISTNVKAIVNNVPIKIPAFIVPLEFDDDQNVTQFFMVPFFGACLHLPPPPPNQTIFVHYPQGLKLESLYDAYWISGIIKTSLVENDMATAAYSMEMHAFELYSDE
ncbi:MAG: hypothetical protein ACI87J_002400 [Colwellia sp.]|jgi:hypothetical protein